MLQVYWRTNKYPF